MLADQFIVDVAGKYSLVGVWENISVAALPVVHPLLFAVVSWEGGANTAHNSALRIWSPSQVPLQEVGPNPLQFGPNGRAINVTQIQQLLLTEPGTHRVELLCDGLTAHYFDFSVQQVR
jgi:hypothetical protein